MDGVQLLAMKLVRDGVAVPFVETKDGDAAEAKEAPDWAREDINRIAFSLTALHLERVIQLAIFDGRGGDLEAAFLERMPVQCLDDALLAHLVEAAAVDDLRHFLSFGHRGQVRHRHHDDQTMQAHCLTLVANACVLSTTHYLQEAIDAHKADGYEVTDEVVAHLSPARFEAINPYGAYTIDEAAILNRTSPRPLDGRLSQEE